MAVEVRAAATMAAEVCAAATGWYPASLCDKSFRRVTDSIACDNRDPGKCTLKDERVSAPDISNSDSRTGDVCTPNKQSSTSVENVCILSCFLGLSGLHPTETGTAKVLLSTIKLLRSCGYDADEIYVVLAHASIYFTEGVGRNMGGREACYILALLTYMAHCHVLDKTCPLRVWHRILFREYCSFQLLNKALMRIMALREYRLRVEDVELANRCQRFCTCFSSGSCHDVPECMKRDEETDAE